MNVERFEIEGLLLLEPRIFEDERGYFLETYSEKTMEDAGIHVRFVQDNMSHSKKGVIRGLHFQRPPFAQAKLVRVVRGEVLDVAVDLREGSPTYGRHQSVVLSESNHKMFFIPQGFAHGFSVLSDEADFEYKVSDFWHPESEGGIIWNDPDLAIDWMVKDPIVGKKDQILPQGLRHLYPDFLSTPLLSGPNPIPSLFRSKTRLREGSLLRRIVSILPRKSV